MTSEKAFRPLTPPSLGFHCPSWKNSSRGEMRPASWSHVEEEETSEHTGARDRSGCQGSSGVTLLPRDADVPTSCGPRAPTRKRGRHVTRRDPLPWKRGARASGRNSGAGTGLPRRLHSAVRRLHNAVCRQVGRPGSPGSGFAARASGPGRLRSRAWGPRGQHQLVSGGRRLQCQAPEPPPGPVRRARGERRRRGLPSFPRNKAASFSARPVGLWASLFGSGRSPHVV